MSKIESRVYGNMNSKGLIVGDWVTIKTNLLPNITLFREHISKEGRMIEGFERGCILEVLNCTRNKVIKLDFFYNELGTRLKEPPLWYYLYGDFKDE